MHKRNNDAMIKTSDTVPRKIYLSLLFERVVCERKSETEQNCNILTLTLLAKTAFLSRSPGLINRVPGGPLCWVLAFSTTNLVSKLVWSPTAPVFKLN